MCPTGNNTSPGNTVSQYAIPAASGTLTALNPATASTGWFPSGGAADSSSSFLYVSNVGTNSVSEYAIGAGGQLSPLSPATVSAGSQAVYVALHPNNKFAYVVNFTPAPGMTGTVSQFSVGTSGQLTPLPQGTAPTGTGPAWLAFDALGQYAYVTNIGDGTICAYSVGQDGSLTVIGTISAGTRPFAIAIAY